MNLADITFQVGYLLVFMGIFTIAMLENIYGYNYRMKRRLKELASPEHHAFLKEQMRLPKFPSSKEIIPYLIAGGALVATFNSENASGEQNTFAYSVALALTVGVTFVFVFAIVHLVATIFFPTWYEVDKEIRVKNFLSTKQVNFLLKNVDKQKRWLSTFGAEEMAHEKEIWNPDKLIPLLKRKDDMDKLIELSEAYETLNRKGSEYTFDQLERKTKLSALLMKGYLDFSPQLKELMEAYRHKEREEAFDEDGEDEAGKTSGENLVPIDKFDKVEQQILSALESFETARPVKTEGREPVRELERVVQSDGVSEETRMQANTLLEQIKAMNEKEESERGREMEELDALAVIQANKLFYGVAEETQ